MSYHNGSVWPHDTAIAAAGMARYGERDAVAMLMNEVYAAATHFNLRLPELFCGFPRRPGEAPIAYPVACLPQAWAAGSAFMMLQAALGLDIDGMNGRVTVRDPVLPEGLDRLDLIGLKAPGLSDSLRFRRIEGRVVVIEGGAAVRFECDEGAIP